MQSLDPLFARLSRSKFRSRFRLGVKERQYCLEKGAPVIEQHAADFVAKRLALITVCLPHYYALLSGRLVRSVLIVWISGLCLPTGLVSNSQRAC